MPNKSSPPYKVPIGGGQTPQHTQQALAMDMGGDSGRDPGFRSEALGSHNILFLPGDSRVHPTDEPQALGQSKKQVAFPRFSASPKTDRDTDDVLVLSPNHPGPLVAVGSPSPRVKRKSRSKHTAVEPTRVYIKAEFMKVGEIDTVEEKFGTDVIIQARWREPALDKTGVKKAKIKWEKYWNPNLTIDNLITTDNDKVWHEVSMSSSGEAFVLQRRRVKGKFAESMELQNFPYDTQRLSLIISSAHHDVELVEETMEPSLIHHSTFVDEQEWRLHDLVECLYGTRTAQGRTLRPSTWEIMIRIHATRRSGFYTWNINAIMVLICSLALCTFTVERVHPTNRLQLSFTLLLTAVAFKYAANQSLPKIPYLTLLDKYILTAMILLWAVSIWHSIICKVAEDSDLGDLIDMIVLGLTGFSFLLYQIIFFVMIKTKVRGKRALLRQLELKYEERVNELMGDGYLQKKRDLDQKWKDSQRNLLSQTLIETVF